MSLLLPNSSGDLESTCDGNSTVSHLKGEQGDSSCSAAPRDRPLRSPSLCSTKMPSVAHLSSPLSWLVLHGCCADLCESRDQFFWNIRACFFIFLSRAHNAMTLSKVPRWTRGRSFAFFFVVPTGSLRTQLVPVRLHVMSCFGNFSDRVRQFLSASPTRVCSDVFHRFHKGWGS